MGSLVDERRWATLRWGALLPVAARDRNLGRMYALFTSRVELLRDPHRARVAAQRISRWTGASALEAEGIYRRCLWSEAMEEADCAFFMRHPEQLDACLPLPSKREGSSGGRVWATLHFGSPILAYLVLCRRMKAQVSIIGRGLDESNPMPVAKRRFGQRKVAWLERASGRSLLGVDAAAVSRARAELLAGRDLCSPIDVPGDVTARSRVVTLCGERVRLAGGIFTLVELCGASLQLIVGRHAGHSIEIEWSQVLEAGAGQDRCQGLADQISELLRRQPQEWWFWPYVVPA